MKVSRTALLAATIIPLLTGGPNQGPSPQWNVLVDQVDTGKSRVAPEFKVAIYENLLIELGKTKRFSTVLRSGDRGAQNISGLLILKTTVESFTPGSEAKRAVTTIAGATKIKVRSQLCTQEGEVLLERVVNGNVRFIGGNLRATHNLARNVANSIEKAVLPEPTPKRSN